MPESIIKAVTVSFRRPYANSICSIFAVYEIKCLRETAIDRLLIIWKSDLSNKIKQDFFQAVAVSILLYGCTTWSLTKCMEKKLDGNYTRMVHAILNESWKQSFPQIAAAQLLTFHLKNHEHDVQDTASEARKNSWVTFFYGPLHLDLPLLANQQELTWALCRHWI